MSSDAVIVAKVAIRVADPRRRADLESPPAPTPLADAAFLKGIEAQLGFRLPRLVKRLYLEVGDGGFGPGYGLFGAQRGHWMSDEPFTLADLYAANHNGSWPDGLVPICEWGCAIRSCIDCQRQGFPMVMSGLVEWDTATGADREAFAPEGIGFRDWIEAWADGVDLWEQFARRRSS